MSRIAYKTNVLARGADGGDWLQGTLQTAADGTVHYGQASPGSRKLKMRGGCHIWQPSKWISGLAADSDNHLHARLPLLQTPLPLPTMDVNTLHHDPHAHGKRTSITELLNPINAPPSALEPRYHPNQLPPLSAAFMGPPHAQPGQPTAQPYPSPMSAPASFSLRAASWDQSAKNDMGIHRPDSDPSACRYPSNAVQHPMYHDAYVRPVRPGEESPAYSMQSPGWHNSPEPANQAYVPSQMSPPMTMYSDERTGASCLL